MPGTELFDSSKLSEVYYAGREAPIAHKDQSYDEKLGLITWAHEDKQTIHMKRPGDNKQKGVACKWTIKANKKYKYIR